MDLYLDKASEIISHTLEAASIMRYYSNKNEVKVEEFEGIMNAISYILFILENNEQKLPKLQELAHKRISGIVNMMPELANDCKISSGELLQYLIEKIGKNILVKTINISDVAGVFGTNEATNWKKLLDL